jgi:hypothetical protein
MFVWLATVTLLAVVAASSFADDISAGLAIDVAGGGALEAELIVTRTNAAAWKEAYVIIPVKGFKLKEQSEVLILHTTDKLGQTLLSVAIPPQIQNPIQLAGTIVIPTLAQGELDNLRVDARNGTPFIYRTDLGIDQRISLKVAPHQDSLECELVPPGRLTEISTITLKFPTNTEFSRSQLTSDSEFPPASVNGSDYTATRTAPPAGYYTIDYRLSFSPLTGKFILSFLVAVVGLLPATLEIFGTAQTRTRRILYLLELLAYIATMVYFVFWNRDYLLNNASDFVAPTISTLVVFTLLISLFIRRSATAAESGAPS